MPDADLIRLASEEFTRIGLAPRAAIRDACVVRQPKAYPVYDDQYQNHVQAIRNELSSRYTNLHSIGRNGMHRYNNQDHSMMTALLTVKNILAGRQIYDTWGVNEDAEYHEETSTSGLRAVPAKLSA
ncbi:MAG: hypothetical protein NW208_17910 [Bryobacter sp.]|nr:hypothetical protein [Bryobacter sp.]